MDKLLRHCGSKKCTVLTAPAEEGVMGCSNIELWGSTAQHSSGREQTISDGAKRTQDPGFPLTELYWCERWRVCSCVCNRVSLHLTVLLLVFKALTSPSILGRGRGKMNFSPQLLHKISIVIL